MVMAKEWDDKERWQNIEDISPLNIPYPTLSPDAIDHRVTQQILKEEDKRIMSISLETFTYERPARDGLEGPPLSLEQCKALVPESFVRTQLF